MAKPTNPILVNQFPSVDNRVNPDTELWSVTTHYIVKKGTDVEQMLADVVTGKQPNVSPDQVSVSFEDFTKLA